MDIAYINFAYIVSSVLFILGIKMLGKPESARRGNMLSSVGMLLAVVVTLFDKKILDCNDALSWALLIGGLAFGAFVGLIVAKRLK